MKDITIFLAITSPPIIGLGAEWLFGNAGIYFSFPLFLILLFLIGMLVLSEDP